MGAEAKVKQTTIHVTAKEASRTADQNEEVFLVEHLVQGRSLAFVIKETESRVAVCEQLSASYANRKIASEDTIGEVQKVPLISGD